MPVLGNYFIDATSLSFATAVFIDAGLSTPAADGYYADGNTVRLQILFVIKPLVLIALKDFIKLLMMQVRYQVY